LLVYISLIHHPDAAIMKSITLTSTQFLSQLNKVKSHPAYLIIGDDGYLVDKVYKSVRELIKKELAEFETVGIYGDELTAADLNDYLDSYSIFSDNKLLVIRNAERLGEQDKNRKQPEKQKQMLETVLTYLKNPEASQRLVLIANSVDGRQTVWKSIKELCLIIECEAIRFPGEMRNWLESTLRQNRKTMDDNAKSLFLEKVELDFCTAENEMEKLLVYIGERSNIAEKDVHTTLPTTRVGTLSDFYKALGNRQTGEVLSKVNDMLENEWADLQILSTVYKFFMNIWKIQALKAKHISDREITATHLNDLFQNQRESYLAFARKYSPEEIPGIFKTILDTDANIKLSMAESSVLMTLCINKICNEQ
jgi:DNA polymerase-3 subunit delta